jgi:hypothetical protein
MCPLYLDGDQTLEPKLDWFDETQFLNWPAVRFSRSDEERRHGDSMAGLSKLSSARARSPKRPVRESARPGPVDISRPPAQSNERREPRKVLPRKEVIQPHLPVRLPCYDFTPIMSPTFDGFLP